MSLMKMQKNSLIHALNKASTEFCIFDAKSYKFLFLNSSVRINMGYNPDDIFRFGPFDILTGISKSELQSHLNKVRQGKTLKSIALWRKRANGTIYPIEIRFIYLLSLPPVSKKPVFIATAIKLSQGKNNQANATLDDDFQKVRNVTAYIQTFHEQERSRIAQEIHDELGQSLTLLKLQLNRMQLRFANATAKTISEKDFESMSNLVSQTIVSARKITSDLRPAILTDSGLKEASQWLVRDFQNRSHTKCNFKIKLSKDKYDEQLSVAAFRILQESLTNATKHAKTKSIDIQLIEKNKSIVLKIKNNGKGFKVKNFFPNSLGLTGMKIRAKSVGGSFKLLSSLKSGTAIHVRLPLSESKKL